MTKRAEEKLAELEQQARIIEQERTVKRDDGYVMKGNRIIMPAGELPSIAKARATVNDKLDRTRTNIENRFRELKDLSEQLRAIVTEVEDAHYDMIERANPDIDPVEFLEIVNQEMNHLMFIINREVQSVKSVVNIFEDVSRKLKLRPMYHVIKDKGVIERKVNVRYTMFLKDTVR